SSAQAHAAAANRGLEALRHLIANLQGSQTLAAEGLIELLPSLSEARHVDDRHSGFSDWFLPPLWNLFSNMGSASSGESARYGFAPVLNSLQRVGQVVSNRRDAEFTWVNGKISDDLSGQMQKALSQSSPETPQP
ncbi:MAG: hypothetical protein WC881_12125, partial [Elusimicrobiota bacterium]